MQKRPQRPQRLSARYVVFSNFPINLKDKEKHKILKTSLCGGREERPPPKKANLRPGLYMGHAAIRAPYNPVHHICVSWRTCPRRNFVSCHVAWGHMQFQSLNKFYAMYLTRLNNTDNSRPNRVLISRKKRPFEQYYWSSRSTTGSVDTGHR